MPLDEVFTPFLSPDNNVPDEQDRLKVFLNDTFSRIAYCSNVKKIGQYSLAETQNGENWLYGNTTTQVKKTRNGFQVIYFISSLPNTGSVVIPQPVANIDENFVMTHTWGTASRLKTASVTGNYFSFSNQGDARISFTVSDTQITITTTTDLTAYQCFIVQEYFKAGN